MKSIKKILIFSLSLIIALLCAQLTFVWLQKQTISNNVVDVAYKNTRAITQTQDLAILAQMFHLRQ